MLEAHGVVLEGRMQIRLGQVPGVARLCEQTQIGELQLADQLLFLLDDPRIVCRTKQRMNHHQESKHADAEKNENDI